jgi:hypothetical protein
MMDPIGNLPMDHELAVEQMATERYLLNEMTPELREEFEQHLFECPECMLDLRAAAAFIEEAKLQLPGLIAAPAAAPVAVRTPQAAKAVDKKREWFSSWWRPVFAMPAFAALLLVIGYQNLATIPALRTEIKQPRILPAWTPLHAGIRGAAHTSVLADRKDGALLVVDLPVGASGSFFQCNLYDPQGKLFWSHIVAAGEGNNGTGTISVLIPAEGLRQGSYTLAISGALFLVRSTEVDRRIFDIHFND